MASIRIFWMYLTTGASSISIVAAESCSGSIDASSRSAPRSSDTSVDIEVSLACNSFAIVWASLLSSTTTGSTISPVWNLISS